jgi:hypothetical protein
MRPKMIAPDARGCPPVERLSQGHLEILERLPKGLPGYKRFFTELSASLES